jgi:hypothetical protein
LVCRTWNANVVEAWKHSNLRDLRESIELLIKNLDRNKYPFIVDYLAALSASLPTLDSQDFVKIDYSFMQKKAGLFNIIKKLSVEERMQLKAAINDQIPNLLRYLFEIADLNLNQAIETGNFQTFLVVFHQRYIYQKERDEAVKSAATVGHFCMLRYLLKSGFISEETQLMVTHLAMISTSCNPANLEAIMPLLLPKGPMSEPHRKWAVQFAAQNNNPTLFRLLLVDCDLYDQIKIQRWIIQNTAYYHPNLLDTVVRLFLDQGPLPTELRLEIVLRRSISLRTRIAVGGPLLPSIGWKTTAAAAIGISAVAGYILCPIS